MKANQSSLTAMLIAAATVMCEHDPKRAPPVGAARWCARFLKISPRGQWLLASARSSLCRTGWRGLECFTLPGIVAHWMCRKRAIDQLARTAAAEGFTQLVVLGAGLDSLAFRMHAEGHFKRVVSADHPATLSTVKAALNTDCDPTSGNDETPASDIELLAVDLVHDDAQTLLMQSTGFDADQATLFVVEGVLMYLPESEVARLFKSLAQLPCKRKRLIASWMQEENGMPIGFHGQSGLIFGMLSRANEKMLWGSTPEKLPSQLSAWGWCNTQTMDLSHHDAENPGRSVGLPSEQLFIAARE